MLRGSSSTSVKYVCVETYLRLLMVTPTKFLPFICWVCSYSCRPPPSLRDVLPCPMSPPYLTCNLHKNLRFTEFSLNTWAHLKTAMRNCRPAFCTIVIVLLPKGVPKRHPLYLSCVCFLLIVLEQKCIT